jgi:hypothetical protein
MVSDVGVSAFVVAGAGGPGHVERLVTLATGLAFRQRPLLAESSRWQTSAFDP